MSPTGAIIATLNLGGNIAGIGMSSTGSVLYVPLKIYGVGIKVIDTSEQYRDRHHRQPRRKPLSNLGQLPRQRCCPCRSWRFQCHLRPYSLRMGTHWIGRAAGDGWCPAEEHQGFRESRFAYAAKFRLCLTLTRQASASDPFASIHRPSFRRSISWKPARKTPPRATFFDRGGATGTPDIRAPQGASRLPTAPSTSDQTRSNTSNAHDGCRNGASIARSSAGC